MVVRRVEVRDQHEHVHDVFVDADDATPVSSLLDELDTAGFHARPFGVNGVALSAAETVGELDIVHGSQITCGNLTPPPAHPTAGVHVVVVCGPDAGASVQLPPTGSVILGRSHSCGLALDDPLLSGQHCRIDVDDGEATVTDLQSTNGTYVEGIEITEPVELPVRSYFQIGSSVLAVVPVRPGDKAVVGDPSGADRVFPRQYRTAMAPLPKKLEPPKLDSAANAKSSSMWWRALLPLGTGVGFAVMSGRWEFLLLMALAPIAMAVTAWQSKRKKIARSTRRDEQVRGGARRLPRSGRRVAQRRARPQARGQPLRRCRPAARIHVASAAVGAGAGRCRLPRRSRRAGPGAVGDRGRRPRGGARRSALGQPRSRPTCSPQDRSASWARYRGREPRRAGS